MTGAADAGREAPPELIGPRSMRQLLDAVMAIGTDLDLPGMLRRITEAATALVDARYGALGVLDDRGEELAEFITVGVGPEAQAAIGDLPKGHGILGLLIRDPRPLRLPDLAEHPDSFGFPPHHPAMTSFLGVPIVLRDNVFGNLYLTEKTTAEEFSDIDVELVVTLAAAAAVAIENARLQARMQAMSLLEDRERIARDLHDTVIQRLFATGLSLQVAQQTTAEPALAQRLESAIDDLDLTIRQIRTAIFGLEATRAGANGSLREEILVVTREAARSLGFEPAVVFTGPLDSEIDDSLGGDILATLREALTNVARHASSTSVLVEVMVRSDGVVLRVDDDGVGVSSDAGRGNGLANMERRATAHGGHLTVKSGDPSGTTIEWIVPRADRPWDRS